jgi:hypothetical protein
MVPPLTPVRAILSKLLVWSGKFGYSRLLLSFGNAHASALS